MPNKLYVGNLPFQVTETELEQLFSNCGEITKIHIPTDRDSGRPRGFAFVEMDSDQAAQDAVDQLDGASVGGRNIKVNIAVERDNRDAPRSSSAPRRPYAKDIGTGTCCMCNTETTLYGFDESPNGVCADCISSLSKASRPKRDEGSTGAKWGDRRPRY